jgi:hypothetical protein
MEQWFAFRAFNSKTLYGFGTDEQADKFADHLNQRREANRYRAYPLTTDEAIELRVDARDDAFNLDDELRALANAQ